MLKKIVLGVIFLATLVVPGVAVHAKAQHALVPSCTPPFYPLTVQQTLDAVLVNTQSYAPDELDGGFSLYAEMDSVDHTYYCGKMEATYTLHEPDPTGDVFYVQIVISKFNIPNEEWFFYGLSTYDSNPGGYVTMTTGIVPISATCVGPNLLTAAARVVGGVYGNTNHFIGNTVGPVSAPGNSYWCSTNP